MIFDHNLDSLIIMFQGINMTTSMMFGNTLYSYYLYCIPAIPFYIITLEEFYTNVMDLPVINAACEGCLSVAVVFLIPVFMGKDIWITEWAYGLPLNKLTMIGFVIFASISTPFVYNNIRTKTPHHLKDSLLQTIPICLIVLGLFYVMMSSPTNIAGTHMRYFMYIVGFNQSRMVVTISIHHKGAYHAQPRCGKKT